jgi:hypothetical protein
MVRPVKLGAYSRGWGARVGPPSTVRVTGMERVATRRNECRPLGLIVFALHEWKAPLTRRRPTDQRSPRGPSR